MNLKECIDNGRLDLNCDGRRHINADNAFDIVRHLPREVVFKLFTLVDLSEESPESIAEIMGHVRKALIAMDWQSRDDRADFD